MNIQSFHKNYDFLPKENIINFSNSSWGRILTIALLALSCLTVAMYLLSQRPGSKIQFVAGRNPSDSSSTSSTTVASDFSKDLEIMKLKTQLSLEKLNSVFKEKKIRLDSRLPYAPPIDIQINQEVQDTPSIDTQIKQDVQDTPSIDTQVPKQTFKWDQLNKLEDHLSTKILGQSYAIKVTVDALKRHVARLKNPKSPIGTFLYVGPTGVGKTQLAKELAIELLGNEDCLIRVDMTGFSEKHSLTRLIGVAPGYEGHEKGGQLTEALKENPHAVVLLDEIEKADPSVLKTLLRVFDEGSICDAQGTIIDCRNVIFILTSNLTSDKILENTKNGITEEEILENIKGELSTALSPELYNRLEVALFLGLGDKHLDGLILDMLKEIEKSLLKYSNISVDWDASLTDYVKKKGYDFQFGARPLKRILEKSLYTDIANGIIGGRFTAGDHIRVYAQDDKIVIDKTPAV